MPINSNRLKLAARAVACLLVVLAAFSAVAQQTRTRSEQAALWLRDQLNAELKQRIPDATDQPLADYPFHFIFLIDSSQASAKSAYPEFVKQTMSAFLRMIENAQKDRGSPSIVSVYPYETGAYVDDQYRISSLSLNPDNIRLAVEKVPGTSIGSGPGGKGGHIHSLSRRQVIDLLRKENPTLEPSAWTKPPLIVQFTTIDVNEVPGDAKLDHDVRPLSARTAGLEGSGLIAYDVKGLPLKTDPPGPNLEPFNVYVWTYGPERFTSALRLAPKGPEPGPATGGDSSIGTIVGWIVGLAALGAIGIFLLKMLNPVRRVTVQRGNQSIYGRDLKRNERVDIWGPGAKDVGVGALILPPDAAPGLPPQKLASMRVVGSQIVLEPQVFDIATPGRQGGGSLAVAAGDRRGFQLTKDHLKTQMLYVTLSK